MSYGKVCVNYLVTIFRLLNQKSNQKSVGRPQTIRNAFYSRRQNLLLYKAVIENNLLFIVFHHLNIHASYNFRLPCKDLQSRLVFVCCEERHQRRATMSKVGGYTKFPVRYIDTFSFFHKFTLRSVDVTL